MQHRLLPSFLPLPAFSPSLMEEQPVSNSLRASQPDPRSLSSWRRNIRSRIEGVKEESTDSDRLHAYFTLVRIRICSWLVKLSNFANQRLVNNFFAHSLCRDFVMIIVNLFRLVWIKQQLESPSFLCLPPQFKKGPDILDRYTNDAWWRRRRNGLPFCNSQPASQPVPLAAMRGKSGLELLRTTLLVYVYTYTVGSGCNVVCSASPAAGLHGRRNDRRRRRRRHLASSSTRLLDPG